PFAFVLMVAVTASGCVLSWRHTSQVIASLGLVGGFLTPLLLSTGADRPIGLFGYVLLLDTGLLYLARQRRWPVLALLSLAGTVFYQALWIGTRLGPDRLLLGLTFHVFVEWEREPGGQGSPAPAAIVASLGLFVLLIVASASTSMAEPWPWLAGSAGLAALLIRHATFPPREFLHLVAALGMGVALAEVESVHGRQLGFPPPSVYFAVLLGAALAFQLVALARRAPAARRMAEYAAAGLAALLLLAGARFRADPFAWYGAALAAPAWFLSLRRHYLLRFGAGTIGLLPVALALVSLTAAVRARERWAESDPIRVGVIAWFGAVA